MMDAVLQDYYKVFCKDHPHPWSGLCGPLSGQIMEHFREDLLSVAAQLESVQSQLATHGHPLTQVRLLEMLIWNEREPRRNRRPTDRH